MRTEDAQSEVRNVYLGGLVGNAVSGILWLGSAGLATWGSPRWAIVLLVAGGPFIHPVTTVILRLLGRPAALSRDNPFRWLAVQAALVLPVSMPLVAPVALYRLDWFFPAMAVLVGAHYLPFATLYGMRSFLALAATLVVSALAVALYVPDRFSLDGWVTGFIILAFAAVGYVESRNIARRRG
jgi:hypothetical protein